MFMARYVLNENVSFIGGLTQNTLTSGSVTTIGGSYDINGASENGYNAGVAYQIPEIALRAELTYQPATKITTTTEFDPTDLNVTTAMA